MKKILSILSLMFLFACSEETISLDGNYQMLNAPENAEITLDISGNEFSGQAAINRYFGSFEHRNNEIKFNPAGSTMMAGPQNLMAVERQFLQDLEKVTTVKIEGDNLILIGKNLRWVFKKQ